MTPTKNRNLDIHERTYVCLKIKEFFDHEKGAFCRGGRREVKKRCYYLFTRKGGVFDTIEKKCPWLRGQYYFLQQDGARAHTKDGLARRLEMQVGTGEEDDFFCRFITQPPNFPDVNLNDLLFTGSDF